MGAFARPRSQSFRTQKSSSTLVGLDVRVTSKFSFSTVLLLGACSTIAPLALNMHVPAMGELSDALFIERAHASLTVTTYLWVFGIGMLFAGIPADRWGRRPTMLLGLGLFSLGAAMVAAVEWSVVVRWLHAHLDETSSSPLPVRYQLLLVARGVQALGASLIVVIPRTMINDRSQGEEAVRLLGILATIMAAAPALAPIAGAFLALNFGWETIFWAQMVLGISLLGISWVKLRETRPSLLPSRAEEVEQAQDPDNDVHPERVIEESFRPLRVIVPPVLIMSLLMAVYYAYLGGGADAALTHFDKTSASLAALLATLSVIYVVGNLMVVRFAALLAPMAWVRLGVTLVVFSIPAVFLAPTYTLTGAAMCLYSFGVGMVMPTSLAMAGSVLPQLRANVMSFASAAPFLLGGALSLIATLLQITTWPRFEWLMAVCVALCGLIAVFMRDRSTEE